MKKILIPMLSLMVLPLAAPSSAKFYSGETKSYTDMWQAKTLSEKPGLRAQSSTKSGEAPRYTFRSWQGHHFDRDEAQDDGKTQDESSGSGKNHESEGSKGTNYFLSKEKRKRQRDMLKRSMRDKHAMNTKGSKGSKGSSKGSKGSKGSSKGSKGSSSGGNDKYSKNMLDRWDSSKLKHYDKDFWSNKDFDKAMLCWLAPHLHEDKEFVNRYWSKWGHKWKWMHKYYKHRYHKHKHEKPPEIPVPASAVLFGSALLGLAAIGKRRHK